MTADTKMEGIEAADPRTEKEALQLGAMDCVPKSGGFFDLYQRIERLLPP